jgi:Uma2 family endonuclease
MVATKDAPLRRRIRETVRQKRWTPEEYERLGELGLFGSEDRTQLIDGVIYESAAQKSQHAGTIRRVARALRRVFGEAYLVDEQLPLKFGRSEPEPDASVLPAIQDDYIGAHPTTALLVVEVSDTTLRFDRRRKMLAYARAAIPEYWIDNLVDEQLEVHRDPSPSGYKTQLTLNRDDSVSPLAKPEASIPVADLLP